MAWIVPLLGHHETSLLLPEVLRCSCGSAVMLRRPVHPSSLFIAFQGRALTVSFEYATGPINVNEAARCARSGAASIAARLHVHPTMVMPREGRASSIPETSVLERKGRGILDRPVKPGDEGWSIGGGK
jgi:hypothetical protein